MTWLAAKFSQRDGFTTVDLDARFSPWKDGEAQDRWFERIGFRQRGSIECTGGSLSLEGDGWSGRWKVYENESGCHLFALEDEATWIGGGEPIILTEDYGDHVALLLKLRQDMTHHLLALRTNEVSKMMERLFAHTLDAMGHVVHPFGDACRTCETTTERCRREDFEHLPRERESTRREREEEENDHER